jgi:phytoene dehydrogenase-like protein
MSERIEVAVIGGGLAGLAAATYLARGGRRVTVFERSREPGGRARTARSGEVALNQGAHALYRGGAAASVLGELGVRVTGKEPPLSGATAFSGGKLHRLPVGPGSLLATGALDFRGKLEVGRFLGRLSRLDVRALDRVSVGAWLTATFRSERARELLAAAPPSSSSGSPRRRASSTSTVAGRPSSTGSSRARERPASRSRASRPSPTSSTTPVSLRSGSRRASGSPATPR